MEASKDNFAGEENKAGKEAVSDDIKKWIDAPMSPESVQEISLEDFSHFLMRKIGEKYRNGMEGLLDRFMSVFNQLSRINQIALSMHVKATEKKKDA